MEQAYSRAGLITALYVAMSVSFCLPHPVAVSDFMICRDSYACTKMLWMCVLYIVYPTQSQMKGPLRDNCLRYYYL